MCPTWIRKAAKRVYGDLAMRLDRMGVLSQIDRNALTQYCQLWARWREAEEFLEKHGTSHPVFDEEGKPRGVRSWPQVREADALASQLIRLEREFGLTPAARASLSVNTNQESPTDAANRRKYLRLDPP